MLESGLPAPEGPYGSPGNWDPKVRSQASRHSPSLPLSFVFSYPSIHPSTLSIFLLFVALFGVWNLAHEFATQKTRGECSETTEAFVERARLTGFVVGSVAL